MSAGREDVFRAKPVPLCLRLAGHVPDTVLAETMCLCERYSSCRWKRLRGPDPDGTPELRLTRNPPTDKAAPAFISGGTYSRSGVERPVRTRPFDVRRRVAASGTSPAEAEAMAPGLVRAHPGVCSPSAVWMREREDACFALALSSSWL